jgi:hypothetical protein
MTGTPRIEAIELIGSDGPIAARQLGLTVRPRSDEETEVPVFLPLDASHQNDARKQSLKLRVSIVRDGEKPTWLESNLYAPHEERAP